MASYMIKYVQVIQVKDISKKNHTPKETTKKAVTTKKIKLVFTGSIGAGKTTAICAISEVDPITTEVHPSEVGVLHLKKTTTIAMDYGELTLDDGEKLFLYGTPGQRHLDFMCSILTKGALGLVVLVDNCHPDPFSDMDYYLNLNAGFLMENPAIIGVTHMDVAQRPNIQQYQEYLHKRGDQWPVCQIDARKPAQITSLIETLSAVLQYS